MSTSGHIVLYNKFSVHVYNVKNGTSLLQVVLNASFEIKWGGIWEGLAPAQIIKLNKLMS